MGRKKNIKKLNIFLNGVIVGKLIKETNGKILFKYDENWIDTGLAISNSLPIQEDEFKGEEVSRYFDNLLPDNDQIRKKIATKFGAESIRPFDLLEAIGRDCVGALSFLHEDQKMTNNYELTYSKLNNAEIARKIRGLSSSSPLGMEQDDFRISIAGAQEKTALLKINNSWYEPHSLTPTTHILKTSIGALNSDINFDDSIDNEWSCLFLMKKMGIETCKASISIFDDQRVLTIERFDRIWKKIENQDILLRLPQEDLCQALGVSPYKKYQNEGGPGIEAISRYLNASKKIDDKYKFFKAIMIFDLFFATDGHAKNFSVFLEPEGFRLTPFYDVTSGYFLYKRENVPKKKLKLAMKVGNSGHYAFNRISKKHYAESAKKCGISSDNFERIVSELKQAYQNLNIQDEELDPNLSKETLEIILEGLKERSSVIL